MPKIKIAELVIDFTVFPRTEVDSQHVSNVADAIRSGAKMPPIHVERKTKRIVDGITRTKATKIVYGEDARIDCVYHEYQRDAEFFLDAIALNSDHGKNLSKFDRVHCLIAGERLQIDETALAEALRMPVDRLAKLTVGRTAVGQGGSKVPLKSSIKHMAGRRLSKKQLQANERLGGNTPRFYVEQLILFIENELLDPSDERLFERLGKLGELIEESMKVKS